MGNLEKESRNRAKRANLKKAVLASVQLVGALGVAMVAPNVLRALDKMGVLPSPRREESIRNARARLLRQGFLSVKDGNICLTEKGEKELRRLGVATARRSRWDGKWRVLIFDIPNYRKGLRDRLRLSLKANGFERLQNSVWIYPHDCEDFVALLKIDLKIGKDMQYLIVDSIENDRKLRDVFNLQIH